jgi:GntR family transcriptional regulator
MVDPLYKQIADDLRRQIEANELSAGDQLRTEIQLQEHYGQELSSNKVSRNTVRDAVGILVAEGLLEKRPGQGTFVVKVNPFMTTLPADLEGSETAYYLSEVTGKGREPELSVPRIEIHRASEAPELKIPEGDQVISRHQRRLIDRIPYSMQTSFYPMDFAVQASRLRMADDIREGAVAYIRESLGIKQVGCRDVLFVRPANEPEMSFFKLPAVKSGIQMIEHRRVAYAEDGRPIRLTVTVYPTDRNRIAYETGKVPPESGPESGNDDPPEVQASS